MAITVKIAVGAILLLAVGAAGARFGMLSPIVGFGVCAAGLILGGVGATLVGAIRLRREGGHRWTWAALFVGVAMLAACVGFVLVAAQVPRIHDITTDPEDPPEFVRLQGVDGREYPDGGPDVPHLQREAYPDIVPIVVDMPPLQAFATAREAAERLGWTVAWAYPDGGRLEAYDETALFRFVDDIAVRVRPSGSGSRIDVRSVSRVGESDLGVNAARIRRFAEALR